MKSKITLNIPNNAGIESFKLEYNPMALDIYYSQFSRDLSQDVLTCLQKYGSITRSLSLRLAWVMCVSFDHEFMPFIAFINCVEYNIDNFLKGWGKDLIDWLMPLLDVDFS